MPRILKQNKPETTEKTIKRGRKPIKNNDDVNEFIEPNNNSSLVIKMEWNKHIIEL